MDEFNNFTLIMILLIILLALISGFTIYVVIYNTNSIHTKERSRIVERRIIGGSDEDVTFQIQYQTFWGKWRDYIEEYSSYNYKEYRDAERTLYRFRHHNEYIDKPL